MGAPLYHEGKDFVYRVWDPIEKRFCSSGRGLYSQSGRSFWPTKGGAAVALRNMPLDIRDRLVIKTFKLVEVES